MSVYLVLACRSLCRTRYPFCPRSCPLYEGDPRRQGQERQDRRPYNRRAAPRCMLPQASVYPAEMRATRDLLRRRMPLARKRGELLAHVHNTNSQSHLPAIGTKIAYKANRAGVAERCADPAVHKSIEVDLALITYYDELLRDVELSIV